LLGGTTKAQRKKKVVGGEPKASLEKKCNLFFFWRVTTAKHGAVAPILDF
jgi:hypothetical protein